MSLDNHKPLLVALSMLCILVLILLFLYTGNVFPSTKGASSGEAAAIWGTWVLLVIFPLLTFYLLWHKSGRLYGLEPRLKKRFPDC